MGHDEQGTNHRGTEAQTDQALGARQATEHLLGLGHRQVWHIAGPETSLSSPPTAPSHGSEPSGKPASPRHRSLAATGRRNLATATA